METNQQVINGCLAGLIWINFILIFILFYYICQLKKSQRQENVLNESLRTNLLKLHDSADIENQKQTEMEMCLKQYPTGDKLFNELEEQSNSDLFKDVADHLDKNKQESPIQLQPQISQIQNELQSFKALVVTYEVNLQKLQTQTLELEKFKRDIEDLQLSNCSDTLQQQEIQIKQLLEYHSQASEHQLENRIKEFSDSQIQLIKKKLEELTTSHVNDAKEQIEITAAQIQQLIKISETTSQFVYTQQQHENSLKIMGSSQIEVLQSKEREITIQLNEVQQQLENKLKMQTQDKIEELQTEQKQIENNFNYFFSQYESQVKKIQEELLEKQKERLISNLNVSMEQLENQIKQLSETQMSLLLQKQQHIETYLNDTLQQFQNTSSKDTEAQIQLLLTRQREIAKYSEQQIKDQGKKLSQVQISFLQTKNEEYKNYLNEAWIQLKNNIEDQNALLQAKQEQIVGHLQNVEQQQENHLKELNLNLISSLNIKFEEVAVNFKIMNQEEKKNEGENYINQQIQEALKKQFEYLIQLIENLNKYRENQNQSINQNENKNQTPANLALPIIPQKQIIPQITLEYLQQQCDVSDPNSDGLIQIIVQLYDNSWKKRYTEPQYLPFVRDEESQNDLFKNYSIRASQIKQKLKGYCTQFRQARGDGNCFYTAFGYQFLLILLLKYDDSQFITFIKEMKSIKLPMKMNLDQIKFDNSEEESQILNSFFYFLIKLRCISDLEERKDSLTKQFGAYEYENEIINGQFYGLSSIFFRNLANYAVEFSEMKEALFDRENLLKWELECNSNEIVIAALANYLKMYYIYL